MKKKIVMLLLLLTTFVLMGTMSAMADSEPTKPTVRVQGRTVEEDEGQIDLERDLVGKTEYGTLEVEGNWIYLYDALLIETEEVADGISAALYIQSDEPVRLCLSGDCRFEVDDYSEKSAVAIYADCPKLTVYGSGSLTVMIYGTEDTYGIMASQQLVIDRMTVIGDNVDKILSCDTLGLEYATLEGALDYADIDEWTFDETAVLKGGETKDTMHDCETADDLLSCSYVKIKNPQYYGVIVNGVELSEKAPSVKCGNGKAYVEWDSDVMYQTLYLDNATITKGTMDKTGSVYAGIIFRNGYDVALTGTNVIDLKSEDIDVYGIYAMDNLGLYSKKYFETQKYYVTKLDIRTKASKGYRSTGCYVMGVPELTAVDVTVQGDIGLLSDGLTCITSRLEMSGDVTAFDSGEKDYISVVNSKYGKYYIDTKNSDGSSKQELSKEDFARRWKNPCKYLLIDEVIRSEVFVNGEEFMPDRTVIPCGEGTATYNFEKQELTLENATITLDGTANLHPDFSMIFNHDLPMDLDCGIFGVFKTLVLKGNNTITVSPEKAIKDGEHYGILIPEDYICDEWAFTVKGTGTLAISLTDVGDYETNPSYGIRIGLCENSHRLILRDSVCLTAANNQGGALYSDDLTLVLNDVVCMGLSGYPACMEGAAVDLDGMAIYGISTADYESAYGGNADTLQGDLNGDELFYLFWSMDDVEDTVDVIHANIAREGLTVTWEKANDKCGYTTYRILRRVLGENGWTVLADRLNATGYYDKTVEPGIQYEYAVQVGRGLANGENGKSASGCYSVPPTITSVENRSGSVRVAWTAVDGADGYYVYRKDTQAGTWHFIGSTQKNLYFNDTDVEGGTVYYYAIKSFMKVDGNTVASASGPAKNTIYLKNNFISKLSNQYSGILKVAFSPSPNCTGYEIVYGTKADLSDGITVPVKMAAAADKSITDLKKGTKYYVKIRAYKTMGGYTFYSNWSAVKSLTLTK